ncbi:MAG TPA: N-acyl homoserine lactonase family protein [Deltaproteobacteria bacterium]|nr:N-acyl homoserine lactonase family protein [Deltaproteobacteria bacterium]
MPYIIHPLTLARLEIDRSLMTYRMHIGEKMWIPVTTWYIKGSDKNILVDTGGSCNIASKYFSGSCKDVISFEDALSRYNLAPEKIDIVILTHLMWDHCANMRKCVNAKVIVQEEELRFAYAPHPILAHSYGKEFLQDIRFIIVRGDTKVMNGIEVLFTPGHSPGCQSVAIETSKGKAIIAGFCCIMDNFRPPPEVKERFPVIPLGIALNPAQAFDSALRIKGLADILLPLHDPDIAQMGKIPS